MVSDEDDHRRCKIFHVVPLTFTLGFVKVVLYTAALILICTLFIKPHLIEEKDIHSKIFGCLCKNKLTKNQHQSRHKVEITKNGDNNDITLVLDFRKDYLNGLSKFKSNVDNTPNINLLKENRRTQLYWAFFMTGFYLLFSLMLLHGILTKNASNMLPFFCLQLFDLVLDLLWLFGHLINSKNMEELQTEFKCLPISKYFNFLSPTVSCTIILLICVIFLMIQFYFVGVVWSCYRYIIASRFQILPTHRNNAYKNGIWGLDLWQIISLPKDKNRTKIKDLEVMSEEVLPKYEEVLKIPSNVFNPPPYIEKGGKEEKQ